MPKPMAAADTPEATATMFAEVSESLLSDVAAGEESGDSLGGGVRVGVGVGKSVGEGVGVAVSGVP